MIKYRVYDTEDKEYLDSFRTAVTPDGEVFVLSDYKYNDDGQEIWEAKLVCSARQEPGRFIIEQYTGLKDKNSTEIAVGDIVAGSGDKGEVVVMRYGAFEPVSYYQDEIMTIIGNIHKNAELLEEK